MIANLRPVIQKGRNYISTPGDVLLAIRITLWTGVLRLLKHVVPLEVLVRAIRRSPELDADAGRERQVVAMARWAARVWAWSSDDTCLERALVRYRFLSGTDADLRLVFGFSRDGGRLKGHAWVVVNGVSIDEDEEALVDFSPAGMFDSDGRLIPAAR